MPPRKYRVDDPALTGRPRRKPSFANYKLKVRAMVLSLELAAQTLRDGLAEIEQWEKNDK